MRLSSSRITALTHRPQQDFLLWDKAGTRPSLDLQFADRKDLIDAISGQQLITHTRASAGTYVGSDGLIKTATTNLLLQSEDFSTTWSATRVSVSTDSIAAPNGTVTADTVTGDGTADFPQGVSQSSAVFSTAGTKTISIYAKAGTNSFLQIYTGGNVNVFANFDLTTGTVGSVGTQSTAAIISAGNGWYRCVLSTSQTNPNSVGVILVNSSTAARGEVAGSSNSFHLWGAQLEASSTVGEYVPTTSTINSAPRFDHDPTTGESLGLLVEESRTNLLTYSEEFDDASWSNNTYVTPDTVPSPDGTTTADTLAISTASVWLFQDATIASGATIAFSVFAKEATTSWVAMRISNPPQTSYRDIWFDLSSGSIGTEDGTGSKVLTGIGSIKQFDNGFYRISGVFTTSGLTSAIIRIATVDADASFTRAGSVYLWGAQLEEGSFPTSYIPTEGSTVTRAADVASISGSNFSGWYRQDEGTVFLDYEEGGGTGQNVIPFSDGSSDNILLIRRISAFVLRTTIRAAAALVVDLNHSNSINIGQQLTRAIGYKSGDYASALNGEAVVTSSAAAVPSGINQVNIGLSINNDNQVNGTIRRLTYWPQRLSNDTLETITQ